MSVMSEPAAREDEQPTESQTVIFRRYKEAHDYGLTMVEARLFAESDIDIGQLRKCVEGHCPPALAARILT